MISVGDDKLDILYIDAQYFADVFDIYKKFVRPGGLILAGGIEGNTVEAQGWREVQERCHSGHVFWSAKESIGTGLIIAEKDWELDNDLAT